VDIPKVSVESKRIRRFFGLSHEPTTLVTDRVAKHFPIHSFSGATHSLTAISPFYTFTIIDDSIVTNISVFWNFAWNGCISLSPTI